MATFIGLPAVGELKYNDYEFVGASTVSVSSAPVRDDANRTVIYREVTLTVAGVITGDEDGEPTDNALLEIRRKISQDGKNLVFKNQGFGNDIDLNGAGENRDLAYGPKTEVIEWNPVGSSQACTFVWRVVFHISECDADQKKILAINYSCDYDISKGFTTRTINGYIQIAQSVDGEGKIVDHADHYREQFYLAKPINYERTSRWATSADKSRVSFTITDTQIQSPNEYPAGVLSISGSQDVQWARSDPGRRTSKISIDVTRSPDQPKGIAWRVFLTIVNRRYLTAKSKGNYLFLDGMTAKENLFGYDASFSASFRITAAIKDFVGDFGLFQNLEHADTWRTWSISLQNTAHHLRGSSKLKPVIGQDKIVNSCSTEDYIDVDDQLKPDASKAIFTPTVIGSCPPKEKSFLDFYLRGRIERTAPVTTQAYLQPSGDASEGGTEDMLSTDNESFPEPSLGDYKEDVIQTGGQPTYYYVITGSIKRICYPIPRYHPLPINGVEPEEIDYVCEDSQSEENVFGLIVYSKKWVATYALPGPPGKVPFYPNVKEGILSEGEATKPS